MAETLSPASEERDSEVTLLRSLAARIVSRPKGGRRFALREPERATGGRPQATPQLERVEATYLARFLRLYLPEDDEMLLTLAIVLLVLWALGFLAFHVTSGLIHILIVIAVIAFIMHFVRGSRSVA